MTLLVGSYDRKIVPKMTYNVSSGTSLLYLPVEYEVDVIADIIMTLIVATDVIHRLYI